MTNETRISRNTLHAINSTCGWKSSEGRKRRLNLLFYPPVKEGVHLGSRKILVILLLITQSNNKTHFVLFLF